MHVWVLQKYSTVQRWGPSNNLFVGFYDYSQNTETIRRSERCTRSNAYSEASVVLLDKLAKLCGVSIDAIVHMEGKVPKEIVIEDKTTSEQMRLIQELDEKDKGIIFSIIDIMLTKKKFKDFFQKNVAAL